MAITERLWAFSSGLNQEIPVEGAYWLGCGRVDKDTRAVRSVGFAPETTINAGSRSHTTASSNHPGGVHVALFDGSVRFVSEHIEHSILHVTGDQNECDSILEYLIAIADSHLVEDF
ncbi:MAG TPA: DUF1559 domain-containing protein [Planctomicrobium sp.]|nr:DUF1559 domain-containing protein [Planctomicrobium sp.]